jgi:hypothetical protein
VTTQTKPEQIPERGVGAEASVSCFWSTDGLESFWETQCGNAFEFIDGGPQDNNFAFCPYCGLPLRS